MIDHLDPTCVLFICAELTLVLVRSKDIKILALSPGQRSKAEQNMVDRGLRRSIILEGLVFVPASAILVLLCIVPLIGTIPLAAELPRHVPYALFGTASYGFPFAAIRRSVTFVGLNTLKQFALIAAGEVDDDDIKDKASK